MRVEKITRRHSRKLVAVVLAALFILPASLVRGQTLHLRIAGTQAGTGFGSTLVSLGDTDADGVPDFAVGLPFAEGGGQVQVVSGRTGQVRYTLTNPDPSPFGSLFGWAITGTGDVNNDSVPDLAVGAPGQAAGEFGEFVPGRVFVFSGAEGSLVRTLNTPGGPNNGMLGYSLATIGDADGDNKREVVAGAPGLGQAFIFPSTSGAQVAVLGDPDPLSFFGASLAVGDVNNDGVDDVAVGAPEYADGRGRVFVFTSGTDGGVIVLDNELPQGVPVFRPVFGEALAMVGDVNGDGRADLAVGVPGQNVARVIGGVSQTFFQAGQVLVFSVVDGIVSRLLTLDNPILSNPELHRDTHFGRSLAAVGDFDGDGVPDLAVGARNQNVKESLTELGQGQAFIFSGAMGDLRVTLPDEGEPVGSVQTNGNSLYGSQIALMENAGGSGQRYLAISAPGQLIGSEARGEVFVYAMPEGTVGDTEPPTVTVPANMSVEATSSAGANVTYVASATDNQGQASVACSHPSGSNFPLGTTTVTCTATDSSSNTAQAAFTVTVRDRTAPETAIHSVVDGQQKSVSNGGSTLSTAATLKFGGSDAVGLAGYYCSWDGAPYAPCYSPLSRSNLSTGKHVFAVRAHDAWNNTDESSATWTWTVLTKAQAAQQIKEAVQDLDLKRREHAKLSALLREIKQRVSNRKQSDDKRACDELDAFLKKLSGLERTHVVSSAEAAPLRSLAESLRSTIGCRTYKGWHAGHHHRR